MLLIFIKKLYSNKNYKNKNLNKLKLKKIKTDIKCFYYSYSYTTQQMFQVVFNQQLMLPVVVFYQSRYPRTMYVQHQKLNIGHQKLEIVIINMKKNWSSLKYIQITIAKLNAELIVHLKCAVAMLSTNQVSIYVSDRLV